MRDITINPSLIPAADNMHECWIQAQQAAQAVSGAKSKRIAMLEQWGKHQIDAEQRREAYYAAHAAAKKAVAAADEDRRPQSIQAAQQAVKSASAKHRAWEAAVRWMADQAKAQYGQATANALRQDEMGPSPRR